MVDKNDDTYDIYEYYERTKHQKFKDSSKLEGINIELPDDTIPLEEVLAKHRKIEVIIYDKQK